jgi:uncharacterized membrane protein YvbJ
MYCSKCGTQNSDNSYKCSSCGAMMTPSGSMPHTSPGPSTTPVPNYLAQSILVTLFCCLPLGIVSIVYAAQVNTKLQAGDLEGAMDASAKARTYCWWSFGLGILVTVLWFAFSVLAGIAGASGY